MRRIITLIAMIGCFVSLSAQTATLVTLDHEGELTFFDNVYGLPDAISAAVDGDKIYLSSGNFGGPQEIIMDKAVSIIGNGYDSHIIPAIKIQFSEEKTYTSPAFEGVYLEKVSNNESLDYITASLVFRACKIRNLNAQYFKSISIDRCYIENFSNNYNPQCKEVGIRNSKIGLFRGYSVEIIDNCNIGTIYDSNVCLPYSLSSSIVNDAYLGSSNSVIMQNCLIGRNTASSYNIGSLLMENCYRLAEDADILDDNLECTLDLIENGYLGIDGTQVGIYGGEWMPYTTAPTLPTVDKSASSVTYDAESNQLKVNIKIME